MSDADRPPVSPSELETSALDISPSEAQSPALASPSPASAFLPSGWNYEATVIEVEEIISQIERGELDLANVFEKFAAAVERLQQCESFLTRQQQQVDLLIETLTDAPESF